MAPQQVLVFGDQTVEKLPSVRKLVSLSRTSPSLRRFLQEATDVVQTETAKVTPAERKNFGSFHSILGLAEEYAKLEQPDEVVATVLVCIERLGELILHVENDPTVLAAENLHILGFCTGLLPGAVAALARDTSDIFTLGREIIAISFRLAIEFMRRSNLIEEAPGLWACTVVGATSEELQEILDEFNVREGIPTPRQAYLGVVSRTWTTVFGPPSVLDKLWATSSALELAPKLKIAAATAVHAAHLPLPDLDKILGTSPLLDMPIPDKASIISSSTGEPFAASTLRELLCLMILDVTQNVLLMEATIQGAIANLSKDDPVELTAIGPSPHVTMVQRVMESSGIKVELTKPATQLAVPEHLRGGSDLIAIVGMSGRFPGGSDLEEFWETLARGADLHELMPKSRFDVDAHVDPTGAAKNSATTGYGCFLQNPGMFDARLFNVSPREAAQMDPLQRLLLTTSYEALEMAGYGSSTDTSRVATYFGQSGDDWRYINESQGVDIYYVPGTIRAFAPGRLNYHFKWGAGYYSVDTACSSSSTTVLLACNALINRECDTALAGGGSLLVAPPMYAGLSRGSFLSKTGACKTFSEDADGYCRGEGVGVVVLKRLEDAIRDNDTVQAVIRGSARNYCAGTLSITQPHAESQEALFRTLLQQTSTDPLDVGFIELHGTGTQAGDKCEVTSVTNVFGNGRTKENPLVIGAVKANVGHGEAAAGITSLIKSVLMLKENVIPPQPGAPINLNKKFPDLKKMNVRIPEENLEFKARARGDGKRKIVLNNFDAAGGNTSLLIEDAPLREQKEEDPRPHHVVTFSGRTTFSLLENKKRLLSHLTANSDLDISDVAYTTTARRLHDVCREAFAAKSTEELISKLKADVSNQKAKAASSTGSSSMVFAFTGQGSQYSGMGRQLFRTSPRFRDLILSYQELCDFQGLPSFINLIASDEEDIRDQTTVQVQLAIVALEIALANLWKSWGIQPTVVIGHSLGEYAALCVSGVLSVSDALYLVGKRSLLLQDRCTAGTYAMLAVASSPDSLEAHLKNEMHSSCEISCRNAPTRTVVSGLVEEIQSLESCLKVDSVKTTLLQVPYGFHSRQIDPILADFEESAKGVLFAKPLVPVASTLTGVIVTKVGTFNGSYLAQQARNQVNFAGALQAAKSKGLIDDQSLFLEIGPQPVLVGNIRSTLEAQSARLFSTLKPDSDNWKTISDVLAGVYVSKVAVNWPEYHRDYLNSVRLLELPFYAFDEKNYWNAYKANDTAVRTVSVDSATPVSAPLVSTFSTTCLQRVVKESSEAGVTSVTFVSETSYPLLREAIQGHHVDGTMLCPASVFYDMAFTAAKYIFTQSNPETTVAHMELQGLEMVKPLCITKTSMPTVKVTATKSAADSFVEISFASISGAGSLSTEHGHCRIGLRNSTSWDGPDMSGTLHLVKKRVAALVKSSQSGDAYRLKKPVVYKLFANVVDYAPNFQSLQDVYVDDDFTDASADVRFHSVAGLGSFTCNPYIIDAIIHLAGFVMNGNIHKPDDIAFISSGLKNMRVVADISENRTYTCYTSIQPASDKGVSMGDVYLFDGDKLVALCQGIKFQKMTKAIFGILTGKDATSSSKIVKHQPAAPAPKKAQPPTLSAKEVAKLPQAVSAPVILTPPSSSVGDVSSVEDEADSDEADELLKAVAAETGFDMADMDPSMLFSDMGVDSLMSIAILGAFKKDTGVELPASFFNNFPTVGEVRAELASEVVVKPKKAAAPKVTISLPTQESPQVVISTTPAATTSEPDHASLLLNAVAEETGFDAADMEPSTLFSDMGVDSLMSISIIAAFTKETGLELPASFFHNFPSVGDVRAELGASSDAADETEIPVAQAPSSPVTVSVTIPEEVNGKTQPAQIEIVSPPPAKLDVPKAVPKRAAKAAPAQATDGGFYSNVVLVQGRSSSKETPLFLICDGAGSATAYIHLPPLPKGRKLYALESPFLHEPEEYNCTISEVAKMYYTAVRKAQPKGPYMIGGWSAGGVYSYETARLLLEAGEEISSLMILDMRVPKSIPDAMEPTMELVEQTGLVTGIKRSGNLLDLISQKQKLHLLYTLRALVKFDPTPMHPDRQPKNTVLVWASLGLDEVAGAHHDDSKPKEGAPAAMGVVGTGSGNNMEDPQTGLRSWFFAKRYTFGPNGWERLVGDHGIDCHKVEADHFSLVSNPAAQHLGRILKDAVAKCQGE